MAETMPQLDRVLAACREREQRDLADLFRLIAQPSISAQNIGVRGVRRALRRPASQARASRRG